MAAVCVFCSSSLTIDPQHVELAAELGTQLAGRGHTLVSGGGRISMMGAVARAAREGGARTVGVIPQGLVGLEVADDDADELVVTPGMRERKALMDARADAFVVLPGGLGTLEELFEVWVARSLGMHDKPIVVCDPTGLLDPLEAMVDHLEEAGFVRPSARDALLWARTPQEALDLVEQHLGHEPHLRPGTEVVE